MGKILEPWQKVWLARVLLVGSWSLIAIAAYGMFQVLRDGWIMIDPELAHMFVCFFAASVSVVFALLAEKVSS